MIDTLKKTVKRIERVVIPLLHDEEKIFLSNIYKSLGQLSLAKLVSNPNEFFGEETQIITVQPSSDTEIGEIEPINVLEIAEEKKEIQSGTPLTINRLNDWVFVPYNHEYQSRNKEFQDELQKESIDINRLKTDPKYILDADEDIKKKIKDIYENRITDRINQNSMFLYSGPLRKDTHIHYRRGRLWHSDIFFCYSHYHRYYNSHRVACLYTGDGDLNKVDVRTICRKYWDLIGTIQIPHHGSLASFNENVLEGKQFLCPISVGENSYGHPSQSVISEILKNGSCPILVTEDVDSKFIEIIED